jgi:hypothetical protein
VDRGRLEKCGKDDETTKTRTFGKYYIGNDWHNSIEPPDQDLCSVYYDKVQEEIQAQVREAEAQAEKKPDLNDHVDLSTPEKCEQMKQYITSLQAEGRLTGKQAEVMFQSVNNALEVCKRETSKDQKKSCSPICSGT